VEPEMENRDEFQVAHLPDGGRLVVFDFQKNPKFRLNNLVCFDAEGQELWTAELPKNTGPDWFVGVAVKNEMILARTWSCFDLTLDLKSGKILTAAWTK